MDDRPASSLEALKADLRAFDAERDWGKFHTPRNLATALAVEAAELMELFQWDTAGDRDLSDERRALAASEVADVAMFLIRFADVAGLDLEEEVRRKLAANHLRWPSDKEHAPTQGGRFPRC